MFEGYFPSLPSHAHTTRWLPSGLASRSTTEQSAVVQQQGPQSKGELISIQHVHTLFEMNLQDHVTKNTKNFMVFIIILKQSVICCHIWAMKKPSPTS